MSRRRQAVACYCLALTLAVALALLGPGDSEGILVLNMLTSAVAVVLMMLFSKDEAGRRSRWSELGLTSAGLRYWPVALVVPALVIGASYSLVTLVYPTVWSFDNGAAVHLPIQIVIISVLAIFEEVCWRGYLLPRFQTGNGSGAAALVGLLHGIWHLPLIVFTTAYNPVGSRWIVIPLFLALLTTAGVIYGWLREMSGSLWPVIVAHGTFNATLGMAQHSSEGRDDVTFAYLTGETGILTVATTIAIAFALTRMWSASGRSGSRRTRGGGRRDTIVGGAAVATVLVMLGASGGAVAAVTIGSQQIADNSIRSRDVRDGSLRVGDLAPSTRASLRGPAGAPGHPGVPGEQGPAGAAGPPGVPGSAAAATVVGFTGPVQSIVGNSGIYVWTGPPAQVTTTAAQPRVTGSAGAPMGLAQGSSPQLADVGFCYSPSGGGALQNFVGSNFSQQYFTTSRASYAAAATVVLPPGTYNAGMCVRNNGSSTISNNNYVGGWVMVTG